jgi:hypothetical protein
MYDEGGINEGLSTLDYHVEAVLKHYLFTKITVSYNETAIIDGLI